LRFQERRSFVEGTSRVSPRARIAEGVTFGPFTVVEDDVQIGAGTAIGAFVVLYAGTVIGRGARIDDHVVIGKMPMRASRSAITRETGEALPPAHIGDGAIIGSSVVIYRGCRIGFHVLVADFASVREEVEVGDYTILGRGVTVENKCIVGKRCKIETEAYITALSAIGDDCFVSPEVTFTNDNFMGRTEERFKYHRGVTMQRGARIGGNATILPGVTIGEEAVVAAGSVVTRDAPPRQTVLGAPARVWRPVPQEQMIYREAGQ